MSFNKLHPVSVIVYFIAVLIIAMFSVNPIIQATALVSAFCFLSTLQRAKQTLNDIIFYLVLFILIAVTNPLFSHNGETPLFFLNGNPVTLEALLCGLSISCAIISVILWCKCMGYILSDDKIIYLFGRVAPKLALILSMALRFIPLFKMQIKKVTAAQKSMGMQNNSSVPDKLLSTVKIMSSMVTWSLENAVEISSSMKARGYGQKNRSSFSLYKFTFSDVIFTAVVSVLFLAVIAGIAFGDISFAYYPYVSQISLSFSSIFIYTAFFALCFIPFIFEVKEAAKWNFYLSRI